MAARAALLRSVANKMMARAPPPRLQSPSLEIEKHGRLPTTSGGGLWFSRFSTSTGGSANLGGPQIHIKKVPSDSGWYRALVGFNKAASLATFMLFGCFAFMHFSVFPALDRMHDNMEAERLRWVAIREEIIKNRETRAILRSNKESQIEATDVSEGQRITGIWTK